MESGKLSQIIRGCKINNSKDQEQLYKEYKDKMWWICLKYSCNKQDAQDNFQDGFIKIFNSINSFWNEESEKALISWMSRIMRNTCLEKFRSSYFRNLQNNILEVDAGINTSFENPDQFTYKEIKQIIMELPSQLKIVFCLYNDGYSHKEISNELKLSISSSKVYYMRARDILREKVITLYGKDAF